MPMNLEKTEIRIMNEKPLGLYDGHATRGFLEIYLLNQIVIVRRVPLKNF
jgi:hypothetical protein